MSNPNLNNGSSSLTQFGGKNANPRWNEKEDKLPPWSIRGSLRRLAALEADAENGELPESLFKGRTTVGEKLARKIMSQALEGNTTAQDTAINAIDGPQERVQGGQATTIQLIIQTASESLVIENEPEVLLIAPS